MKKLPSGKADGSGTHAFSLILAISRTISPITRINALNPIRESH